MNYYDDLFRYGDAVALESVKERVTYSQLSSFSDEFNPHTGRCLVFCVCSNTVASVVGLIGCLRVRMVPVLINNTLDKELYKALYNTYQPQYVWCTKGFMQEEIVFEYGNYTLVKTAFGQPPAMDDDLAMLLTTSGSTGSPKLVRQTYRNVNANTESIVEYLGIKQDDIAITTLPMSYTYGLSILQTHLLAGARVVMTDLTIFDKEFWNLFKDKAVTTFGAVPYTYQMLDRLRFLQMELTSLRYITQAGGKLGSELHYKFAKGLRDQGKKLVVMYGATEATARMSYVPSDLAVEKAGSIGIPIPGGRFAIMDTDGNEINSPDIVGELVYYGDNVTLGYAECREDLDKGDERNGRLETGDMARVDEDGFYYVVGRKKRFLKLYGNRINLVEIEELLSKAGYECACVGEDDHMRIYTTTTQTSAVVDYIAEKTGVNRAAFTAIHIGEIPHNNSGKVLYSALQ